MYNRILREGLEHGDLGRGLVDSVVSVDRFKSKLGRDEDIVVVAFGVKDTHPAHDLMSFIEKGYEFVIDSDVSTGENAEKRFDVFVEIERDTDIADNIVRLVKEVCNLTNNVIGDWKFTYRSDTEKTYPLDAESLSSKVPTSPEDYLKQYPTHEDEDDIADSIDQLKSIAGLPIKSKAPKDEDMNSIRSQAGLI
jgi:hypothetical protein